MEQKGGLASLEEQVAAYVAQVGNWSTYAGLVLVALVSACDLWVFANPGAPGPILAGIGTIGPLLNTVLGAVSTGTGYYGRSRQLRGLERISARDEASDQALNQAGNTIQNAPQGIERRLGCRLLLGLGVLIAGIILTLLTYGKVGPFARLWQHGPERPITGTTGTPTVTPTLAPGTTLFVIGDDRVQVCNNGLSAYALTLVNLDTHDAVAWSITVENGPSGHPWASASPASGTLPPGSRQQYTITPASDLCKTLQGQLYTFTYDIHFDNGQDIQRSVQVMGYFKSSTPP